MDVKLAAIFRQHQPSQITPTATVKQHDKATILRAMRLPQKTPTPMPESNTSARPTRSKQPAVIQVTAMHKFLADFKTATPLKLLSLAAIYI
jgi:hypothetical protein